MNLNKDTEAYLGMPPYYYSADSRIFPGATVTEKFNVNGLLSHLNLYDTTKEIIPMNFIIDRYNKVRPIGLYLLTHGLNIKDIQGGVLNGAENAYRWLGAHVNGSTIHINYVEMAHKIAKIMRQRRMVAVISGLTEDVISLTPSLKTTTAINQHTCALWLAVTSLDHFMKDGSLLKTGNKRLSKTDQDRLDSLSERLTKHKSNKIFNVFSEAMLNDSITIMKKMGKEVLE